MFTNLGLRIRKLEDDAVHHGVHHKAADNEQTVEGAREGDDFDTTAIPLSTTAPVAARRTAARRAPRASVTAARDTFDRLHRKSTQQRESSEVIDNQALQMLGVQSPSVVRAGGGSSTTHTHKYDDVIERSANDARKHMNEAMYRIVIFVMTELSQIAASLWAMIMLAYVDQTCSYIIYPLWSATRYTLHI